MQVTREIDAVDGIVVLTVSGELSDEGLLHLYDEIAQGTTIGAHFLLIVDLTESSGRNVTPAGVRALARRPLVLSPDSRRAVVVPSSFGFGMARMYEILRDAEGGSVSVFRDRAEAERWVRTREA